jgi:hypothetical protein
VFVLLLFSVKASKLCSNNGAHGRLLVHVLHVQGTAMTCWSIVDNVTGTTLSRWRTLLARQSESANVVALLWAGEESEDTRLGRTPVPLPVYRYKSPKPRRRTNVKVLPVIIVNNNAS